MIAGRHIGFADEEAQAVVDEFGAGTEYHVVGAELLDELRAAVAARREADERIEAAALAAHRAGVSWGVIGAQLGVSRQGARQRFSRLVDD